MLILDRKTLLPVLIWVLVLNGIFIGAIGQQLSGGVSMPCLSLRNLLGWISSAMLLFLVSAWPISLERLMQRLARQPMRQTTFFLLGIQQPGLILLYGFPLLAAATSFGGRSLGEMTHSLLVIASVAFATLALFNLGFYFNMDISKIYFLCGGILFAAAPAIHLSFKSFFGKAPRILEILNPFSALFAITSTSDPAAFVWVIAAFSVIGAVMIAFPLILALPPRFYRDLV